MARCFNHSPGGTVSPGEDPVGGNKNRMALFRKDSFKKIPILLFLVRHCRRLARPGRFLVWHTPHEPFRSELVEEAHDTSGAPFLDIASGHRRLSEDFVNLDLVADPEVDVLGDACSLPFRDESFGLVWLEAALEHLPDPAAAVAEVRRVLKPNGIVYVEVPFMQGYHADPGDFQRYTTEGLWRLFSEFDVEWVRPCSGPASAFCYSGTSLFAALFSFRSRFLYKIFFHYVFCYIFFLFKFLDRFVIDHPEGHRTAFGYALLAKKSNGT